MTFTRQIWRIGLLAAAMLSLLAATWAGLLRLGWLWPGLGSHLPAIHGSLMVGGFLGTLISLERAVAVGRPWALAAPIATALGGLLLLAGGPIGWAALLITLGSLVTVAILVTIVRLQPALFTVTIALGTLLWSVGNLLWLAGQPVFQVVLWWAAFLLLTIAGERLELSRLLRLPRIAHLLFVAAVGLTLLGLLLTWVDHGLGSRVAGLAMLVVSLWLLRYDIAWRRIKAGGLARYIALALLAGYVWLGIGGLLALRYGALVAGPLYDAFLHALFLGFAFSMIFAHAPIVFPAVLGLPVRYSSRFYLHLGLLQVSLLARVAGDLLFWQSLRQWSGLINALVLLLFLANTLLSVRQSVRQPGAG